jgi:hypothetical protein
VHVKLLVVFDPAYRVLVHGHPFLVAVLRLLHLLGVVIGVVLASEGVGLVHAVRLLYLHPVLLVLGELLVTDLASPL